MSSSLGVGDAGESRMIVCDVDVSVGVSSSGGVGASTTNGFNSQSAGGGEVVTHGISTSDGAGGGDVASHSRSCENVDMFSSVRLV